MVGLAGGLVTGYIEMGTEQTLTPYCLYNFVQDGVPTDGTLTGRGSSGSAFDAALYPSTDYWRMNDHRAVVAGPQTGPLFGSTDFGGATCGDDFSFVIVGEVNDYMAIEWWKYDSTAGLPGGRIEIVFDTTTGSRYFDVALFSKGFTPRTVMSGYLDDLFTPTGTFVLGISINPSGAVGWFNDTYLGAAPTRTNDASCSAVDFDAQYGFNNVFGSAADNGTNPPLGFAAMRGTLTEADMLYWMSYDWASHPGFA